MVDLKKKKKKSDGVLIITFVLLEREKNCLFSCGFGRLLGIGHFL